MSLPYYKRFPRDFLEGTIGLSFELKGAYSIVLDLIYMRDGRLTDDAQYIAGQLGCSVRKWKSLRDDLVTLGKLSLQNGIISNFRADYLLEETRTFRDKQVENRSRPNKNNEVQSPKVHLPEPDTDTEVSGVVERASDFRERCFKAAGLDPKTAMAVAGLTSTVTLELLIRDQAHPCDPDLDVIPAIEACAASLRKRGQTISNWSYCREAALRNRDQRLAGNPAPTAQPARRNAAPATFGERTKSGFAATGVRLAAQVQSRRGQPDGNGDNPDSGARDELAAMWADRSGPDGASTRRAAVAVAFDDGRSGGEEGPGRDDLGTGADSIRPQATRLAG